LTPPQEPFVKDHANVCVDEIAQVYYGRKELADDLDQPIKLIEL